MFKVSRDSIVTCYEYKPFALLKRKKEKAGVGGGGAGETAGASDLSKLRQ